MLEYTEIEIDIWENKECFLNELIINSRIKKKIYD